MIFALLHPGDLGLSGLLLVLLVAVGVPALVLFVLASAVYKGLQAKKDTFTVINFEADNEPTGEGRGREARP
jgi:hypothetical protein